MVFSVSLPEAGKARMDRLMRKADAGIAHGGANVRGRESRVRGVGSERNEEGEEGMVWGRRLTNADVEGERRKGRGQEFGLV